MLSIFPCDYWLFVYLGEMFIQVFWSFFNPVVCFCCCWIVVVYIPWILTPYQIHDLQVFSPDSVDCIFTLVYSVLWYTKVFYFDVGSIYFFCGMCFSFCFFPFSRVTRYLLYQHWLIFEMSWECIRNLPSSQWWINIFRPLLQFYHWPQIFHLFILKW